MFYTALVGFCIKLYQEWCDGDMVGRYGPTGELPDVKSSLGTV